MNPRRNIVGNPKSDNHHNDLRKGQLGLASSVRDTPSAKSRCASPRPPRLLLLCARRVNLQTNFQCQSFSKTKVRCIRSPPKLTFCSRSSLTASVRIHCFHQVFSMTSAYCLSIQSISAGRLHCDVKVGVRWHPRFNFVFLFEGRFLRHV